MNLSVSKLPWYGQVGAFALVSALATGRTSTSTTASTAPRSRPSSSSSPHSAPTSRGARPGGPAPEFRAQVVDLEARLDGLKAVLPEQKDVGDLLRRLQTLAAQSNLEIRGSSRNPSRRRRCTPSGRSSSTSTAATTTSGCSSTK